MIKELAKNLEIIHNIFEALLPPLQNTQKRVSIIRIPATAEEYASYVSENYLWTSGIWMPEKKELVIKPQEWGSNKEQKNAILSTTYHEAFHQYLHYLVFPFTTSAWFNEGFASFFGSAVINNNQLIIKEDEQLTAKLLEILERKNLYLDPILSMTYEQFYDQNPSKRHENYALAWGIIYFLQRGALVMTDTKNPYQLIIPRYLSKLIETGSPETATEFAFSGIDKRIFHTAFSSFWKSRNKRAEARHLPAIQIKK